MARRGVTAFTFLLSLLSACCAASEIPLQIAELEPVLCAPTEKPWSFAADSGQQQRVVRARDLKSVRADTPFIDLRPFGRLSICALRTDRAAGIVRLHWVIHSRAGGQYQSQPLPAGTAARASIPLDLGADNASLVPAGHQRPWDDLAASQIESIELCAECSLTARETFRTGDTVSLVLSGLALEPRGSADSPQLLDLSIELPPPGYDSSGTLNFRLAPLPADPFASSGPGDVRITLPDGKQALAFVDQEFVAVPEGSASLAVMSGRPFYRAHLPFVPESGLIRISGAGGEWSIAAAGIPHLSQMKAAEGAEEFNDGRWNFPGQVPLKLSQQFGNFTRCWSLSREGSWRPADEAASSFARKDSRAWRPVPFWNADWGAFSGIAAPDLALCRRMDAMLADAAARGERLPLIILDGEGFERQGVFNWSSHPLKGALAAPGELLNTPQGIDFSTRWMRYCVARWGNSRAVESFLLTVQRNNRDAAQFHARAAEVLKDWNAQIAGARPVYSLHPLAREPQVVAELDPNSSESAFRVWQGPTGTSVTQEQAQGREGFCFLIRAREPKTTSIGLSSASVRTIPDWRRPAPDNFSAADALLFDVWVPPDAPHDLRAGVHLRNRDGQWFQALLPGLIEPGEWSTFALDITGQNRHGLQPVKHKAIWTDYSRQRITEVGLHVYSTHADGLQPLSARFDHMRAVKIENPSAAATDPLEFVLVNPSSQGLKPKNAAELPREFARGDLFECHFKVNRIFSNPFDPRECDLSAVVTLPSGKTVRMPAFLNQLCERREAKPGGDEIVEAVGEEFFTVRYRFVESGAHQIALEWRSGGRYDIPVNNWQRDDRFTNEGQPQPMRDPESGRYVKNPDGRRQVQSIQFVPGTVAATLTLGRDFKVSAASKGKDSFRGFVRAASDKRHFEFEDGGIYYPVGPCLRSPSDTRLAYANPNWTPQELDRIGRRGTYQYDEYFDKFGECGINWARVWMCSWWGALEWRRDWPGYQGVGRYNLLNAWRIDYILKLAEKYGVLIDLGLNNHGQYSVRVDTEWVNNPYNAALGGPLACASEVFTRADAKILMQNRLRYVVARYGHSPWLFSWTLFSEVEFTEEYERSVRWNGGGDAMSPHCERWHSEMAGYLKSIDPNRHLVVTHFSHPRHGYGVLGVPEIDVATSNAYSIFDELDGGRGDAAGALSDFWNGNHDGSVAGFKIFGKPALVEEQGRHYIGFERRNGRENNTKIQLEADLHAELWGSMVQPLAGATGYWWWLHLHYDNQYGTYRAFTNFMKGEDPRPKEGETQLEPIYRKIEGNEERLCGRVLRSDRRVYAWVYHENMPLAKPTEPVSGGIMRISNLQPGIYNIEFWNTYKGELIEKRDQTLNPPAEAGKKTSLVIKLPTVDKDIALKVKRKE